jgi:Protein of unknown function (DUF1517)
MQAMTSWGDRFQRARGKTRLVVCRLMIHLAGKEVAPILGVLNRAAREAIDSDGDLSVLGEGLAEICQTLLQYDLYWRSAANEGDVFWDEGAAGEYVDELFTDAAQRYQGDMDANAAIAESPEYLSLPVTENLVVILTIASEGEVPALETDLADLSALKEGLKTLINLHYQQRLRAIQVHFSPARLGDNLDSEQLLLNFPELIPL